MKKAIAFGILVLFGLALLGCSDDSNKNNDAGKTDKGIKKEARVEASTSPEASAEDVGTTPDKAKKSDKGGGTIIDVFINEGGKIVCDKTCQASAPSTCLKDTAGKCYECTSDAHCTSNPFALGNTCDKTNAWCVCSSDSDCANNPNGHYCDTTNKGCACSSTAIGDAGSTKECGTATYGAQCYKSSSGLSRCYCKADADCTGNAFGYKCDTSTGVCSCSSSTTDCPSGKTCAGKYGSVSICQ